MSRILSIAQKKKLDQWFDKQVEKDEARKFSYPFTNHRNMLFFTDDAPPIEQDQIESLNPHETFYQNADRYILDKANKLIHSR